METISQTLMKQWKSNARKPPEQIMKYEQAAYSVFDILGQTLTNKQVELVLDQGVKNLYSMLTKYFINDASFESYKLNIAGREPLKYKLRKGLLLLGNPGRSKTYSLQTVFRKFTAMHNKVETFKCITSLDLATEFQTKGASAMKSFQTDYIQDKENGFYLNLYIDEIGMEAKNVKNFGNDFKPMELLLQKRYELTSKGRKTHATSNLTLPQLKKMYAPRTYSRLFEMFNIIQTDGQDLRIV